jgi:sec-independent protein translocase protein TatA
MILGLGPLELVVIILIVLVIFGPKNLPKLGKSLGQTVKNVREGMEDEEGDDSAKEIEAEAPADDEDADVVEGVPEPAEDVQFCPKCGTQNPATSGFCSKCGSKLGGADE